MTYRITTDYPTSGTVTLTEVFRGDAATGPLVVADILSGEPVRDARGRFIYEDFQGGPDKFYRVVFYDAASVILLDTGVFSPNTVGGADLGLLAKIDHNRSTNGDIITDALRYVGESGAGLADVTIRVYRQADFDAFRTDAALGTTRTDENGRWLAPIFVEPGQHYAVVFYKEGLYGPDVVRVLL